MRSRRSVARGGWAELRAVVEQADQATDHRNRRQHQKTNV